MSSFILKYENKSISISTINKLQNITGASLFTRPITSDIKYCKFAWIGTLIPHRFRQLDLELDLGIGLELKGAQII